jgi:uncharacterized protein
VLERDGYIPGVPCWADTSGPDAEATAAFYADLFGWEVENVMPPESGGEYYIGRIRGGDVAAVAGQEQGNPAPPAWNTYIWVQSADETSEKVYAAGGRVLSEPFDVMDAGRMAVFADPEGAVFCVWQANQHKGSKIVNEHGSVNFNNLNTRDLEAAKAFYGAVFGWEVLDMPSGQAWTMPGYGDHLEEKRPGLRKDMAAMGAPAGFEDVVAGINLLGDEQADVPAHWSITFAVDDADAIARRASELGGEVLSAPFDVPWVRLTVLRDPRGATFIAGQFKPENKDIGSQAETTASAA